MMFWDKNMIGNLRKIKSRSVSKLENTQDIGFKKKVEKNLKKVLTFG